MTQDVYRESEKQKVFCIGLSKTGTTSLNAALIMLGYNSIHNPEELIFMDGDEMHIDMEGATEYDALSDIPPARFYKELDERFQGSKFVLTTRDEEAWLASCEDHFHKPHGSELSKRLRYDVYGTSSFDREKFRTAYRQHTVDVEEYFRSRPDDLLVINTSESRKMEILCGFLGLEIPDEKYPHENASVKMPKGVKNQLRKIKPLVGVWKALKNSLGR